MRTKDTIVNWKGDRFEYKYVVGLIVKTYIEMKAPHISVQDNVALRIMMEEIAILTLDKLDELKELTTGEELTKIK